MNRISQTFAFLFELLKIIVLPLLIVVPIRIFIFQPFIVRGESMAPAFHQYDYLIIDEISYRFHGPQRGDVIVFRYPKDPRQYYIKRIIGLPGETVIIEDGNIKILKDRDEFILKEPYLAGSFPISFMRLSLEDGEYAVFGDNRVASSDSRNWGALRRSFIVGKVFLRAWPLPGAGFFESPVYNISQ